MGDGRAEGLSATRDRRKAAISLMLEIECTFTSLNVCNLEIHR